MTLYKVVSIDMISNAKKILRDFKTKVELSKKTSDILLKYIAIAKRSERVT